VEDAKKARLRNTARIVHWVMQLLLIAAFILTAVIRWSWHEFRDVMARSFQDEPLLTANGLVVKEFSRYFFLRGQRLLPYAPPKQEGEREAWAAAIAEDFDQPVAVFVRDDRGLIWVTCPPDLEPGKILAERLFASGTNGEERVTSKVYGAMETRRVASDEDTLKLRAVAVGPTADSLRWGIVFGYRDTWRAFFRSLNKQRMNLRYDDPSEILEEIIQLPCTYSHDDLPRLRAFIVGEEVFASPGLDTTRHRYVFESGDLRAEFYGTQRTALQAKIISRPFISWQGLLITLILMLVVHLNWRWIKRLTDDAVGKTIA